MRCEDCPLECRDEQRINWPFLRGLLIAFILSLGVWRFIWQGIQFAMKVGVL